MKIALLLVAICAHIIAFEPPQENSPKQTQKIDMHGGKSTTFGGFNPKNQNQPKSINEIIKKESSNLK